MEQRKTDELRQQFIALGALVPAYAGIRPRTRGPSGPAEDFIVQGPDVTGHASYIALDGIDSPGLTASLAIGDYLAELTLQ